MKVDREKLLEELEMVLPGVSLREIIEQSSCFVFKDRKVMTYNDEIGCTHKSCLSVEGAVQAMPFIALLRKLKEKRLGVAVNTSKSELVITGKRKQCGLKMDVEILLPIDAIEQPKKWKDLPDDFSDAVSVIQHCAGKDETRFALTCIHLHPNKVEACDGYQAASYKTDIDLKVPTLIRRESLKSIVSMNMVKFSQTKHWIHFKSPNGLIISCRHWLAEDFPDIASLLKPKGRPAKLPKGLAEAVEKAEIFSSESSQDNLVTVNLLEGKLRITGRGSAGYYQEVKKVKYRGPSITFRIAPNLLVDLVLRHNTCEIAKDRIKVITGKYSYVSALDI